MALLSVYSFSQILGRKQILSSITFHADAGQVVVLLGPNGAGKTTLLKSIIGILQSSPESTQPHAKNTLLFEDEIINNWPIYQRIQAGLLYVPQHSSLFQSMTVYENLAIVYHYHQAWENSELKQFNDEVDHWLNVTHLTNTLKQPAGTLSGGQKRKLEVIRALLMKPKMLLLDEPFAGVDPKSIYELKTIFTNMAHDGIGVVISDHHVDQLLSIGQTVYVIIGGRVVSSGSIREILENTYTKESYLGTQFYEEMAQRFLHEKGS
ncbi:MAG: ATP-binding cassette domain-containing protein [Candidatus Babeliales bacterium]|jgi:lipopolysaccharide export system ATP-binding protein